MANLLPAELHLAQLKKEIESMHASLNTYSKKSSANPEYVKLRAEALSRLVSIYNGLENEFRLLEVLYPIAISMKSLISKDPEIGQFAIHLHIKQNGNCGYIYYNSLE